ncbi:MAG: hypothetical protein K0U12_02660, partial [Gammaproteobacteria bacterium]|nr:hypothetical protein [Gammaproteobacteria bacterium]
MRNNDKKHGHAIKDNDRNTFAIKEKTPEDLAREAIQDLVADGDQQIQRNGPPGLLTRLGRSAGF